MGDPQTIDSPPPQTTKHVTSTITDGELVIHITLVPRAMHNKLKVLKRFYNCIYTDFHVDLNICIHNLHDTFGSPYPSSWNSNNRSFGCRHNMEPELGSGSIILQPLAYFQVHYNCRLLIYVYLPIL